MDLNHRAWQHPRPTLLCGVRSDVLGGNRACASDELIEVLSEHALNCRTRWHLKHHLAHLVLKQPDEFVWAAARRVGDDLRPQDGVPVLGARLHAQACHTYVSWQGLEMGQAGMASGWRTGADSV